MQLTNDTKNCARSAEIETSVIVDAEKFFVEIKVASNSNFNVTAMDVFAFCRRGINATVLHTGNLYTFVITYIFHLIWKYGMFWKKVV